MHRFLAGLILVGAAHGAAQAADCFPCVPQERTDVSLPDGIVTGGPALIGLIPGGSTYGLGQQAVGFDADRLFATVKPQDDDPFGNDFTTAGGTFAGFDSPPTEVLSVQVAKPEAR
jgi:hypothetical protein